MRVPRIFLAAVAATALLVFAGACSSGGGTPDAPDAPGGPDAQQTAAPLPVLTPEPEPSAPPRESPVPAVMRALQSHDTAALLALAAAPGQAPVVEACDGTPMPRTEPFADVTRRALGEGGTSTVFAVLAGSSLRNGVPVAEGYVIALTPGVTPRGDVAGTLWYITKDGAIAGVRTGCGAGQPLASLLASDFPDAVYVLRAS